MVTVRETENQQISYLLYADNDDFFTWTDWVNDPINSPTNTQQNNAANYSNYVLKLKCEL